MSRKNRNFSVPGQACKHPKQATHQSAFADDSPVPFGINVELTQSYFQSGRCFNARCFIFKADYQYT
jgi:hypothetical protein